MATQPSVSDATSIEGVTPTEWETASADSPGFRSSFMEEVLGAGAATPGLRSLLVVRNGVLIGEQYYLGMSSSDLLPVNSITKSVTSILTGIAIERGSLSGVSNSVARLLPEAAAQTQGSLVATLRLEDILKGRTGLAYDISNTSALVNSEDPVALALGLPRTPPTPSGWTYNDPVVGLLSPILARAEDCDLAAMAARDLFSPLGIERYAWRHDRQGKSLSYAGLALRTRDLAKIAWTMANAGVWRGKQVVPQDWVAQSTKAYGPVDWRLPQITNIRYGYLWFSGSMSGRQVVLAGGTEVSSRCLPRNFVLSLQPRLPRRVVSTWWSRHILSWRLLRKLLAQPRLKKPARPRVSPCLNIPSGSCKRRPSFLECIVESCPSLASSLVKC